MIYYIRGKLVDVQEGDVVVETANIGYAVAMSALALNELRSQIGQEIRLWIKQRVNDDEIVWYGFMDQVEREVFERLVSVSGVGPKSALSILSMGDIKKLTTAIDHGNVAYISQASGIGKKTAQRILVELKGKLVDDSLIESDVEEAMKALGYKRGEYEHLVAMLPVESTVEEKIGWLVRQMG